MSILVTGAAGFIGFHTSKYLLERGEKIIGIDNVNDYYDTQLKEDRLKILEELGGDNFIFHRISIADKDAIDATVKPHKEDITHIIHLAAQAGVRYSIENPMAYSDSNLTGHVVMMEVARHIPNLKQFIYASSSSVYGHLDKVPFSVSDRVDNPVSLYAATKKSCELLSESYVTLYKIPTIGLRFFTVYGPFGRPDMAYFSFTKAIHEGQQIKVFNHGKQQRDFTYVDDIVSGIVACADSKSEQTHRIYNLGNNQPVELMDFIKTIEKHAGKDADLVMIEAQKGDVSRTYADITESQKDLGYSPKTSIDEGIGKFSEWYKSYYKI